MGKLANIAQNILGADGEYISLDSLIANYPEGVTINGAHIRHKETGDFPCFTFAEDSTKYFYAVSGDLAGLFKGWLAGCEGSLVDLNDELQHENIKLKIQKVRTKGGKTYTKAWVVGTVENPRVEVEEPDEAIPF